MSLIHRSSIVTFLIPGIVKYLSLLSVQDNSWEYAKCLSLVFNVILFSQILLISYFFPFPYTERFLSKVIVPSIRFYNSSILFLFYPSLLLLTMSVSSILEEDTIMKEEERGGWGHELYSIYFHRNFFSRKPQRYNNKNKR